MNCHRDAARCVSTDLKPYIMRNLITAILLFCLCGAVFANGDPVAVTSAITLSSSPVAVHVPEVQMLNEQVLFVPNGKYTEVTVRYLLHNQSKKDFKNLPYGEVLTVIETHKEYFQHIQFLS